jgi:hypothetical protein
VTKRTYHRALPQNLHIMPKGARTSRLCGATSGGFVRQRDEEWLRRFLRDGGGLCPECAELAGEWLAPLMPKERRAS